MFKEKHLTFFNIQNELVERMDLLSFNHPFHDNLSFVLHQLKETPKEFEVYFGKKKLDVPKADFVFQTINNGAEILSPDLWHHFSLLAKPN
jgi:hypothetical protein